MMHALALTFDVILIGMAVCTSLVLVIRSIIVQDGRQGIDLGIAVSIALVIIGRIVCGVLS